MSALTLLEQMVAIPSVNPFRYFPLPGGQGYVGIGAEAAMNHFVEERLRDAGFEVSRQPLHGAQSITTPTAVMDIPERWNVVGVRFPKGRWNGKSILFFGHTDTVDVKHGWESNPFTVTTRIVDGRERWFGLGVNDMKGGLAALLEAVKLAHAQEYAIKVAFVVDEEYYSFGAEHLCRSDFLADVTLAIAPEVGDRMITAQQSSSSHHQQIGLGRTGRVEYDFEVIGRACHGADTFVNSEAVNAVHEAIKLQAALVEDCARAKRMYSAHGADAINAAYISYQRGGEPMLSVPDRAAFILDRTFLPDESPDAELLRLQELVSSLQRTGQVDPRARITVATRPRPTEACRPYVFSPEIPEVARAIEAVKANAASHSFIIDRSVADENRVAARGIPTLTIGPIGSGSHTNHEWVDPRSVEKVVDIFRSFISMS